MSTTSQTPANEPALLDVDDVAKTLNCSTMHVRRMADAGRMPRPVKLGSLVRWHRDTILRWLADGCPSCKEARR